MKKEEVFITYNDCVLPTYTKTPLVFVKGKGSRLWDIHNRSYLDFFPGWGVGNLGHCHPKVVSAAREQLAKLIFIPNNYYHIPQAQLARELIYRTFKGKVFFCNSGTEANEAAIKLSRKYGRGRYEIITFENSFHGRTLGSLAATAQKKYQDGFSPLPEGFKAVPFNDIAAVKQALTDKTVAVMIELIQGEGGVNVADKPFVKQLRDLCTERGLLLIIDEVQTGVGRCGKYFCFEHYDIVPDIITVAKALAGGLPIGAMVVRDSLSQTLGPGMHASTFGGGPVICKAALAVLKAIQSDKLLGWAQKMSEYIISELLRMKKKYPVLREVRGIGLMIGCELTCPGAPLVEQCAEQGLLINCTHERVIRLMPALTITKSEVKKGLRILERVIKEQG